jgi:outer membrane protein assembly factor BamB
LANNVVFFGSYDGNFYALNAKDGSIVWTFKTEGEKPFPSKEIEEKMGTIGAYRYDTWTSSPAIKNNTVYFGSGDGNFYALDERTGREKWKFKTKGIIHSSPALAFGNVYFGGWDTYLHALDESTGNEKWKFKTGEDTVNYNQTGITSSPVVVDSMLYFGCRDSHLYAVKAITGELIWKRYNDDIWVSAPPLVFENRIIYSAGRPNRIFALNRMTGELIYQHVTITSTHGPISMAGRTIYYGDLNGMFHARDFDSGAELWRYELPPSVADALHIRNPDGSTSQEGFSSALEKNKGQLDRNQVRFSLGSIFSSPVIKDGVIYFGAYDGCLYALK